MSSLLTAEKGGSVVTLKTKEFSPGPRSKASFRPGRRRCRRILTRPGSKKEEGGTAKGPVGAKQKTGPADKTTSARRRGRGVTVEGGNGGHWRISTCFQEAGGT